MRQAAKRFAVQRPVILHYGIDYRLLTFVKRSVCIGRHYDVTKCVTWNRATRSIAPRVLHQRPASSNCLNEEPPSITDSTTPQVIARVLSQKKGGPLSRHLDGPAFIRTRRPLVSNAVGATDSACHPPHWLHQSSAVRSPARTRPCGGCGGASPW